MATNNSTLYLMSYNNYYNRIVKREATLDDYPISADYVPLVCNFNPADGIDTEHVMNVPYIANTPEADYLVVVGEDGQINSRWFIVNATRTRGGQYRLSLHRDLIADFYDAVVSSPTYIERATLPLNSPLIYNSENMLFNQIKTSETLLKDATQTPWIVAYLARGTAQTATDINAYAYSKVQDYDFEYSLAEISSLGTVVGDLLSNVSGHFIMNSKPASSTGWKHFNIQSNGNYTEAKDLADTSIRITNQAYVADAAANFATGWNNNINTLNSQFYGGAEITSNQSLINQLNQMNGKIIRDTNSGSLYTIKVSNTHKTFTFSPRVNSGMYNTIAGIITNLPYTGINTSEGKNTITVQGTTHAATVQVETVPGKAIKTTIPTSAVRENLIDAPWDMLAIPYLPTQIITGTETSITTQDNTAIAIAQALPLDYGKDNVYDIQLLPFCPCPHFLNSEGKLDISNSAENTQYIKIFDSDNVMVNVGFFCYNSSFTTPLIFDPIINPTNAVEFKINNECDVYRLVSPNYSGVFEFSATKNGGILGFEANCSYKPYQPFIHINPQFGGLYGRDYNDNRGLICGGNFSLPSTTDAWTEYQVQNKSWSDSFQRQIVNMETTFDIQMKQQKGAAGVGIATATISGATTGAMAGSVGGPVGAIAGGVAGAAVGGVASGIGMAQDLKYAEQLQKEALSYTRDQFDLSLQNIKALPNTLSNVGAFDINYKYFPFLEYYTATDIEKNALRNKIKYNGMTANVIGTISQFQQGTPAFVSGSIIRLEGITEDFHCAAAIANEIHKGVYI